MPTTNAIVLCTTIQHKSKFVAQVLTTRESDNRHVVDHTEDPAAAMQFDSKKKAQEFLDNIVNPFEREYAIKTVKVKGRKKLERTLTGDLS